MSFDNQVTYLVQADQTFLPVLYEEEIYMESDPAKLVYLESDQANSVSSGSQDLSEYKKKRAKNNEAVRRSREKSKVKYSMKESQITKLRKENKKLADHAAHLRNTLAIYQDLVKCCDISLTDQMDVHGGHLLKFETGF